MSYVVNNHLNNLYVISNKAVGLGKKSKINKHRAIPEARVLNLFPFSNYNVQWKEFL
jgi:hypothetical protein